MCVLPNIVSSVGQGSGQSAAQVTEERKKSQVSHKSIQRKQVACNNILLPVSNLKKNLFSEAV